MFTRARNQSTLDSWCGTSHKTSVEKYNYELERNHNAYKSVVVKILQSITNRTEDYIDLRRSFAKQIVEYLSNEKQRRVQFRDMCKRNLNELWRLMHETNDEKMGLSCPGLDYFRLHFTVNRLWQQLTFRIDVSFLGGFIKNKASEVYYCRIYNSNGGRDDQTLVPLNQHDSMSLILAEKTYLNKNFEDIYRTLHTSLLCKTCREMKIVTRHYGNTYGGTVIRHRTHRRQSIYMTNIESACDKCMNLNKRNMACSICNRNNGLGKFCIYKHEGVAHKECYARQICKPYQKKEIKLYSRSRGVF